MRSRAAAQVETAQLSGRFSRSFTPLVVLQAVHLAELTGNLRVRHGVRLVTVSFERGEVVAADALDCEGVDAVVALNEWTDGRFDFVSGPPASGPAVPGPFNWLMLEVCRRLDEETPRGEVSPSG
jgi:hypothetical protein